MLTLLTVKNLESGLEKEGLAVTGPKGDLVRRLSVALGDTAAVHFVRMAASPVVGTYRAHLGHLVFENGYFGVAGQGEGCLTTDSSRRDVVQAAG